MYEYIAKPKRLHKKTSPFISFRNSKDSIIQKMQIENIDSSNAGAFNEILDDIILSVQNDFFIKEIPYWTSGVDCLQEYLSTHADCIDKSFSKREFQNFFTALVGRCSVKIMEFVNADNSILEDEDEQKEQLSVWLEEDGPRLIKSCIKYIDDCEACFTVLKSNPSQPMERGQALSQIRDQQFGNIDDYIMESEPGYTLAMLRALTASINYPFPADSSGYLALHKMAIDNVSGLNENSSEYRPLNQIVSFGLLKGSNYTPAGWREYNDKRSFSNSKELETVSPTDIPKYLVGHYTQIYSDTQPRTLVGAYTGNIRNHEMDGTISGSSQPLLEENTAVWPTDGLAEMVFHFYQSQINATAEDKTKLHIIAETCQTLDQLHLFNDANIRTIYLLLNQMLVQNGFPRTALKNPNIIDCFSISELIDNIMQGQEYYRELGSQPTI